MRLLLPLLFLAFSAQAFAAPPNTQKLQKDLEAVLAIDEVARSKVGMYVVDVDSGDELFTLNADELFNPASNTKLVTAAAALDTFGPAYTLTTRVSYAGTLKDGAVDQLWLKSDGDPFIVYEDVMRWAVQVKRAGILEVRGDVMVDDLSFGPGFVPPGFDQKDEDASYRAPIGAVSVNFNAVTVTARAEGDKVVVDLHPPNDYVIVKNTAKVTKGKGQRIGMRAVAEGDRTRIEITGTLGENAPAVEARKRIDNPSLYAASIMRQALIDVGVKVGGGYAVGTRPSTTTTVVLDSSEPLSWALDAMNKWSNNFIAEQMFRLLGTDGKSPATTQAAQLRIQATLKKLGVKDGYTYFNGSGLYTGNLFSPRQLGQVLLGMSRHRFAPEFEASLAIAGADGTLQKRLETQDLRGKTGTLNEVTALSGYMRTAGGRHVAYVILFNDTPVRAWGLRDEQDKLAQAIANWKE